MSTKTVELTQSIKGHRGQITKISLREPKYGDFMDLGMPTTWVSLEKGGFSSETASVIGQWIERLADCDPNFLQQLSLRDTLALRGAVLNFFIEAALPVTDLSMQSLDLEEPSPSTSNSTLAPSTI
jgi:hypothetical protein